VGYAIRIGVAAHLLATCLASSACGGRDTKTSTASVKNDGSAARPRTAEELARAGAPDDVVVAAAIAENERASEADERSWNDAQLARLGEVYGPKPAQLGSLLEGIRLGMTGDWSRAPGSVYAMIAPRLADRRFDVSFDAPHGTLTEVTLQLVGELNDENCKELEKRLTTAWGPSRTRSWQDPTTHQRATLDDRLCELVFANYLDPRDWVNELPLTMVGTPVDKLVTATGATRGSEGLEWWRLGLPTGRGETQFVAFADKSKQVERIRVYVRADARTATAVRDALAAKLGSKPRLNSDGEWVWKSRVPVALVPYGDESFTVLIGAF
jgi:hypothetical protein